MPRCRWPHVLVMCSMLTSGCSCERTAVTCQCIVPEADEPTPILFSVCGAELAACIEAQTGAKELCESWGGTFAGGCNACETFPDDDCVGEPRIAAPELKPIPDLLLPKRR